MVLLNLLLTTELKFNVKREVAIFAKNFCKAANSKANHKMFQKDMSESSEQM